MPALVPHGKEFPTPFWASGKDALLYHGHVVDQLKRLPARSVHCAITSPPYWGLRAYLPDDHEHKSYEIGAEPLHDCDTKGQAQCGRCFICSMVSVFREVRRVLRDDGTCWLNLGDSYNSGTIGRNDVDRKYPGQANNPSCSRAASNCGTKGDAGLESGNLVGIPWRVALALQYDGWVLRQDIIWYAPNKMPESVTNRCSKSHEHIFLLAKGEGYFYDHDAIQVPAKSSWKSSDFIPNSDKDKAATAATAATAASCNNRDSVVRGKRSGGSYFGKKANRDGAIDPMAQSHEYGRGDDDHVNKRDVWIVTTQGYPGAHFATFSPKLIEPCILAGTSAHGCCTKCGTPYQRLVSRVDAVKLDGQLENKVRDRSMERNRNGVDSTLDTGIARRETLGWRKMCQCDTDEVEPCLVLDPFMGSGTTAATAIAHGRRGIGCDLNERYLRENAIPRIEAALKGEKVTKKTVALPVGAPLEAKPMTFGRKL